MARTARIERPTRNQDVRESDDIHEEYDDNWEPPGLLDASKLPPRPGFVQRWVRTKLNGVDDAANVGRKYNQGWRPRPADTVPSGVYIPRIMHAGASVVGMEGMILMERPEKLHDAHARRNQNATASQMRSVDENLFRAHTPGSGMSAPRREGSTRVTKGRPAPVADD